MPTPTNCSKHREAFLDDHSVLLKQVLTDSLRKSLLGVILFTALKVKICLELQTLLLNTLH